jgi:ubiquinone/menaquinone biosynthesis C-methylase UbiE
MPDQLFDDPDLAALYDLFSPSDGRGDFTFYLPLIMSADSVLDVGCGTGALLHMAREQGHKGRLCGIDPAHGMLGQARTHDGIEWVLGDLASTTLEGEFDLVLMSGHAFQVFVEDSEAKTTLAAIESVLTEKGRFAFETRNPLVRAWEQWDTEYSGEVTDSTGAVVRVEVDVDVEQPSSGENEVVRFSHTFTSSGWSQPRVSHSTLRFIDVNTLSSLLNDTGFIIEQQFGDWDRSPLTDTSPEIITIAKRA